MATAAVSIEPSDMECPVCNEYFTEPKILPCAHILCKHCLVSWLRAEPNAQCPICRCKIADGKKPASKTPEDIANELPTDLAMAGLVHSAQTLSKDHVCCVHPGVDATSICLNCNDMLCQPCAAGHTKLSVSRHHDVQDLTSLTAERLAVSRPATCSTHPDKTCEFFCRTHNTVVCQSCVLLKHRACPEVTEAEEKAQEARAVLTKLSATLRARETALERAISQLDQELIQTDKTTQENLKVINDAFTRLEKTMKQNRQRLRDLQQTENSDAKEVINKKKAVFLERRGKLTSHRCLVDRVGETVSCSDLFDMTTTLQETVNVLDTGIVLPDDVQTSGLATMTISHEMLSHIERKFADLLEKVNVAHDVPASSSPRPGFRFHANHGVNIKLSNNQQTAERVQRAMSRDDGIVVSCDPMETNYLYEVVVDQAKRKHCYIPLGVIDDDVANVRIPCTSGRWQSAVAISWFDVKICGTMGQLPTGSVGNKLDNLRVGSRVGVLIDAARCLHAYTDGVDRGVAALGVPQTCYAFFHVLGDCKKVSPFTVLQMTSTQRNKKRQIFVTLCGNLMSASENFSTSYSSDASLTLSVLLSGVLLFRSSAFPARFLKISLVGESSFCEKKIRCRFCCAPDPTYPFVHTELLYGYTHPCTESALLLDPSTTPRSG